MFIEASHTFRGKRRGPGLLIVLHLGMADPIELTVAEAFDLYAQLYDELWEAGEDV